MMNPQTKKFEPITEDNPAKDGWPQFQTGTQVEINGVMFAIRKITGRDLVLRPVQDTDNQENRAARRKRLKK